MNANRRRIAFTQFLCTKVYDLSDPTAWYDHVDATLIA
jgi:hypothetical protein